MATPTASGGTPMGSTSSRGEGGGPGVPDRPIQSSDLGDFNEAAMKDLSRALSYAGFNTIKIREKVIRKTPAKDLIKILIAAANVGNRPERLTGKITNPDKGRETLDVLRRNDIKSAGAVGAEDLTLARVATAFAPLYFAVRKSISDTLQNQDLGTGLSVEWQSPSLALYHDIEPRMMPWLQTFGRQIKPRGEDAMVTDSRTQAFAKLAASNRTRDPYTDAANLSRPIRELVAMAYSARAGT